MTYAIIKNAPPPPPRKGGGARESRYPFAAMAIGDAFDLADDGTQAKNGLARAQAAVSAAACSWASYRKNGWKFTTRRIDAETIRIWRTA